MSFSKVSLRPGLLSIPMLCLVASWIGCSRSVSTDEVLSAYQPEAKYPSAQIQHPLDETVFPPDLAPFTFQWAWTNPPGSSGPRGWLLRFQLGDTIRSFLSYSNAWTPSPADWQTIKTASATQPGTLTILGFTGSSQPAILCRGTVTFTTSADAVAAPIFYREVNLPFLEAVKDPSKICWRLGTIDTPQPPPVVLTGLPVCGNCHSFSADGRTLGMDVDYANNKGSYAIAAVASEMELEPSRIISWGDYRKEDGQQTYGLLSQVSPNGHAVISTVKDKSIFVPRPEIPFSQLFFPIQGILVVYNRTNRTFTPLPGADDTNYVQSNPVWSPDGQTILFARAKAYQLRNPGAGQRLLLTEEDCAEFLRDGKPFQFDIYRVPYNGGRGGTPEPLPGASRNGRSNFFPKYSPDGKWIVFCQASNYMLLQPDSELFIVPSQGGEPRRLRANLPLMNSWHSWSPNGKWLVFSSKANSPYTQLYLTHISESGESSPAVLLSRFTAPDRAANIPEFVNVPPGAIQVIQQKFLDDLSHARAGYVAENSGEIDKALTDYRQALQLNPKNPQAHQRLGFLLYHVSRQYEEGASHTRQALELNPQDGCAWFDLALILIHQGKLAEAVPHLEKALRLLPGRFDQRYNPAEINCVLGDTLSKLGRPQEAAAALQKSIQTDGQNPRAHYLFALSLAALERFDESLQSYTRATSIQPKVDTAPELHFLYSIYYQNLGKQKDAVRSAQRALDLARAGGDPEFLQALRERLRQAQADEPPGQ